MAKKNKKLKQYTVQLTFELEAENSDQAAECVCRALNDMDAYVCDVQDVETGEIDSVTVTFLEE